MTSHTLTKAEIDAMEALDNLRNDPKESWKFEIRDYLIRAFQFIPKAIARIRELESLEDNHAQINQELGRAIKLREMEVARLKEQTRWRHIDQERPPACRTVAVWHDTIEIPKSWGGGYSFAAELEGNYWKTHSGVQWKAREYPRWKPLPTKGPDE